MYVNYVSYFDYHGNLYWYYSIDNFASGYSSWLVPGTEDMSIEEYISFMIS